MRPSAPGRALPGEHVRASEGRDERVRGSRDELGRRPDLANAPVRDRRDAVGKDGRVVEVVRHEQDREIELVDAAP